MSGIREKIYLAALLHDIGKFYQRADTNSVKDSLLLSEDIKKMESYYCPLVKNENGVEFYGYKHVLYTAQFIENYGQRLEQENIYDKKQGLVALAANHHKPTDFFQSVIQKADHYSSGIDRTKEQGIRDAKDERNWKDFRKKRMRSIFEGIYNDGKENYKYLLPLNNQQLRKENTFPRKELEFNEPPDYKGQWKKFEEEIKFLQQENWVAFSNSMLQLLKKYTSAVPSSTMHLRDVSLFDHLKTTAAFAISLFDYLTKDGIPKDTKGSELEIKGKPFRLIGGDISGIQKFIYGIIPRRAAKNLKGRSFFIHLLSDSIVTKVLEEFEVYEANVVFASGGTFYIIVPNIDVESKLTKLRLHFEQELINNYGLELKVFMSSVEFGEDELFGKKVGEVWDFLMQNLQTEKKRPFQSILQKSENGNFFDTQVDYDPMWKIDAITGEFIKGNSKSLGKNGDPDDIEVDPKTYAQIQIGKQLRNADYWVTSRIKLSYFDKDFLHPFQGGGYHYLISETEMKQKEEELRGSADNVRSLAINNPDFLDVMQKGINNYYGFDYYGGNKFPVDNSGKPKLFEELAGVEYEDDKKELIRRKPNLVRLGILRMDVDSLGTIFREGFSPEMHTFSRLSTLSRSLDYFFKGYLNTIWNEDDVEDNANRKGNEIQPYNQYAQIIYSGGDDLFIIGKWDRVTELAREIQRNFREYVCHNPKVTLSGGLAVVPSKFPLLRSAELSGNEEKSAKSHFYGEVEKNSFSLFGYPMDWDNEFQYVYNLMINISKLIEDRHLPEGFSNKMYTLLEQAKFEYNNDKKKYQITNLSVIWMVAYNFSRAASSTKNDITNKFLKKWSDLIFTGRIDELKVTIYHPLQLLALAGRWADFNNR